MLPTWDVAPLLPVKQGAFMTQRVPLAVLLLLLAGGFRGAQERLEAVRQRHIRRWAMAFDNA
ncbi:hypothetical protein D3C80_1107820 [compost metagenome]